MKLAIIGSRTLDQSEVRAVIDRVVRAAKNPVDTIVSGGANGVDAQAEAYAHAHGIATEIYLPDYAAHGRRAPLVRNNVILENTDAVLAIWDGESRGTAYTVHRAKKLGLPVLVVRLDAKKPYAAPGMWAHNQGRLPRTLHAIRR